jgi:diguanylate cyclase (GGDEF)-like protein
MRKTIVTTTPQSELPPGLTPAGEDTLPSPTGPIAENGLEVAHSDVAFDRRIAAMLETLGQIGHEITANLDAVAVFQVFIGHIRSLLPATAFSVWLIDAAGQRLMLAFGIEGERVIAQGDIPIDDVHSLAACAVRERRETVAANLPPDSDSIADDSAPAVNGAPAIRTALFAPLIVADRVLGVVSIGSERPDAYSEHQRSIFRTVTTFAAIALDNAAAYAKLEQTVLALEAARSELARQSAEFERLSMTDALTGVANSRSLRHRAEIEIAAILRKPAELSVAMFDVDHFKRVNDTHGHAVGDVVLHKIAQVARESLRPGDLIARVGGEEFALLLPGAGVAEAVSIAERIRASISQTVVVVGAATVRVTSSFGVATFDPAKDTLDHALSRADRALYAAKLAGRDRVLATASIGVGA